METKDLDAETKKYFCQGSRFVLSHERGNSLTPLTTEGRA